MAPSTPKPATESRIWKKPMASETIPKSSGVSNRTRTRVLKKPTSRVANRQPIAQPAPRIVLERIDLASAAGLEIRSSRILTHYSTEWQRYEFVRRGYQ